MKMIEMIENDCPYLLCTTMLTAVITIESPATTEVTTQKETTEAATTEAATTVTPVPPKPPTGEKVLSIFISSDIFRSI